MMKFVKNFRSQISKMARTSAEITKIVKGRAAAKSIGEAIWRLEDAGDVHGLDLLSDECRNLANMAAKMAKQCEDLSRQLRAQAGEAEDSIAEIT